MSRRLTSRSSLETLKREAKRWLQAIRANDPDARARLARAIPDAPPDPTLRDIQHALAREHGFAGWTDFKREIERRRRDAVSDDVPASRDDAITALLRAALEGNAERVARVLDAHPDIVSENAELPGHTGKRTALHFAMNGIHEAVVDVLLARGADPNVRDEGDDAMPLHFAAERGNLAVVRSLIEHGADPNGDGDMHELGILGWAVCFEYAFHREVAEHLLAHGARHTIFTAVAMGDSEAIRAVVARSPDELNRQMDRTNHRRRPLHLAVVKQQPGALATLLELGADTEATDAAGLTPLDHAALRGDRESSERLIDAGARIGLPAAIALERHATIERLLREEPDALRPGQKWGRLIIRAAERAPATVIETLIRHGASVHVRDDARTAVDQTHGYTALHAAAWTGNVDAVRVLLRHGANPMDREDKYWGTPAGWADYAGRTEVRDLILEGAIDIFDAIAFDRSDRISGILAQDPQAIERKFGAYVNGPEQTKPWLDSAWTPLAFAVANGKTEAVRLLLDRGADTSVRDSDGRSLVELARHRQHPAIAELLEQRAGASPPRIVHGEKEQRVAEFLLRACGDWGVPGTMREVLAKDADRMLDREPAIARASVHTAAVCGDLEELRRILDERPEAVSEIGGPRRWPPILYVCSSRLGLPAVVERSVDVLRLLLDRGADPNAFYLGGNADIHYTALTCVLGRGEEIGPMHPRAREMAALLLERGADPHDNQVLYNVFADNTSRHLLNDDIIWLLELMYRHSIRRGHADLWKDPSWPMFDMGGAPSLGDEGRRHRGARFMLDAAVESNSLKMAAWMLEHGADPNTGPGELWQGRPKHTLYEEAMRRGHVAMAELLVRHGARRVPVVRDGIDAFVDACLAMDEPRVRAMLAERPEWLRDHRPMWAAIDRERTDVVSFLLDLGVSPDVEDTMHGRTRALHLAAAKGAAGAAQVLIDRGADVDFQETAYDATPIGWAAYYGRTQTLELLARYSRNVWTLTYRGFVERLREVLAAEPSLARATNEDRQTPLFWLPSDDAKAAEIVRMFLEHGADPGVRDARGQTAADVAMRRRLDEAATLLRRD